MLTLFQLWDELLTKFSKEFENPENILEQLKADERLGDRTEPLLRSIQRDLFFLEEFITPETLNTYHYNFCKNQTTGIRTNSRFILEAYTRNLPPNPIELK